MTALALPTLPQTRETLRITPLSARVFVAGFPKVGKTTLLGAWAPGTTLILDTHHGTDLLDGEHFVQHIPNPDRPGDAWTQTDRVPDRGERRHALHPHGGDPVTRLDHRAHLAVTLARTNAQLALIHITAELAEFATPKDLAEFRAGLQRARLEVQRAERDMCDLLTTPEAFAEITS